jgi:hypothetical protein
MIRINYSTRLNANALEFFRIQEMNQEEALLHRRCACSIARCRAYGPPYFAWEKDAAAALLLCRDHGREFATRSGIAIAPPPLAHVARA